MDIRVKFPGGKRVDADVNGFTIRTDQPEGAGGSGSAPEPYTLFMASIGTCAGYYVLSFCQARELPTEGVELVQRWERDPETKRLTKVSLQILVPAGFPERYLPALERAAANCAVKKALEAGPEVEIRAFVSETVAAATP